MAKDERFVKIYSQGFWGRTIEIWVDQATGVNYICTQSGYAGGMTPLLKPDGTPVVTPVPTYSQY